MPPADNAPPILRATPRAAPAAKPTPATPISAIPVAPAAAGVTAKTTGVVRGPAFGTFTIGEASLVRALRAFRLSCPSLVKRVDASGLSSGSDWQPACSAVSGVGDDQARNFFATQFEVVQVGTGAAFATGYYEPEIPGSRTRLPGYDIPIYRKPPELVEIDLGQFSASLAGKKIRGKVQGGTFVPFSDRKAIEEGALANRNLEIAWAKDAVDVFFLQVQGSGRLHAPDGTIMRVGYEGQNGKDYTGIGKLMKERGLLGPGQTSMQGISDWIHANPDQGREIMRENKSWVFFKELTGEGTPGSLGRALTPRTSVAADPAFVPLGAPVFLSMDRAEANGLWVAQDTGGAIKGANRFDTFWGAGKDATAIAGGMSARGTAFLLLPLGSLARLTGGTTNDGSSPRP